jgi:uncharacterized Rmd1/YagE family protein
MSRHTLEVSAWFLGSRLDLRELEPNQVIAHAPLTLALAPRRWIVAFRFGVIVFFGFDATEEQFWLDRLSSRLTGVLDPPEHEATELQVDPGQHDSISADGQLVLVESSVERIQIIAQVLAKSVVLAHYEKAVASTFERFESLIERLRQGLSPRKGRDVINEVGQALTILTRTVGRVEVTEKPDLTWENPHLDRLYQRLAREYELHDRDLMLTRKLDLLWRIAETYLDLLNNRQGHRLEWYIIILILIEIALTLAEKLHLFV